MVKSYYSAKMLLFILYIPKHVNKINNCNAMNITSKYRVFIPFMFYCSSVVFAIEISKTKSQCI